ncbi:hypothetical protein EHM69_09555 [candidate division KSB1 bacterium]|nr:MAG: hypothetical protein EHM69_09555 [candidate division KSB1 bacterium]
MRIEGYGLPLPTRLPSGNKTPFPAPAAVENTVPNPEPSVELTPQEKLRQLLEDKRWMAEAAFNGPASPGELGKHIDLRV